MEERNNSRDECSMSPPMKGPQGLRRAFQVSRAENKRLAAENAALREQIASKELMWEQEKKTLLGEKDTLVSTLYMARTDMERMVTQKVEQLLKAAQEQAEKVKLSYEKTLTDFNTEWESRWIVQQEEVAAELTTLQQDCESKVSRVRQEKDEAIASVRQEMMAQVEVNVSTMRAIETVLHQSEAEWQTKLRALEERVSCEQAAQEESVRKTEELQRHNAEMEEVWLTKEKEWLSNEEKWFDTEKKCFAKEEERANQASEKEEQMKRLILKSIELQELALKTDREKAKMKKEEKKAQKEAEKSLKKEMKEKEERDKKEKEENEKREKERLKRAKREKKEREKSEKD